MITLKCLYESFDIFRQNLKGSRIDALRHCTVEIYTADLSKDDAVSVAKSIKQLLPNSQIFGVSTCGVVYNGEQYDNDTLIIVKKYDASKMYVSTHQWENKSAVVLADEIVLSLSRRNPKMLNIVFSDHYSDIHEFVECFNTLAPTVKLFGGIAGNILSQNIAGYVFTDEGVVDKGVIINATCGDDIHTYCTVNKMPVRKLVLPIRLQKRQVFF